MKRLFAVLLLMSSIAAASAENIINADTTTGIVVGGHGGIMFATGGIGEDQQEAMSNIKADCNLHLTFSQAISGEYLADVTLVVRNGLGQDVFNVESARPLFYAKLPSGKYVIVADWHGKQQKREVVIAKTGAKNLYLYWPQ